MQVFSCAIFKNFESAYFEEHLRTTAPERLKKIGLLLVLGKLLLHGKQHNWAADTFYWYIHIDILTFFLEYSRIQDGRLKTLSCKVYHAECGYYCDKNSNILLCVCVCVCLFPSTVEASPDWNKAINVMPEIRPAMLCWGNHFMSSTFITIS